MQAIHGMSITDLDLAEDEFYRADNVAHPWRSGDPVESLQISRFKTTDRIPSLPPLGYALKEFHLTLRNGTTHLGHVMALFRLCPISKFSVFRTATRRKAGTVKWTDTLCRSLPIS